MAVNYITLRPSRLSDDSDFDPNGPGATLLSGARAEGPLGRALQRSARTFWADNAGPPDEREARNAAERFRGNFASAWRNYSQQTDQDAIDGFDGFHAALDASRDKILSSVSGGASDILEPVLDRLHLEGAQIGLAHWDQHNRAALQRLQMAQAERDRADQSLADAQYIKARYNAPVDGGGDIILTAGGGNDTLYGGKGTDTLTGPGGSDDDAASGPQVIGETDRHGNPADIVPSAKSGTLPKARPRDYLGRAYPGPGYVLKGDVRPVWKYDPAAALAEGDVEAKFEPDPFVTEFRDYIAAKFNKSLDGSILGPLFGGATLPANAIFGLNDQQVKDLAEKLRKLGKVDMLPYHNNNLRDAISGYLNSALPDQKQAAYDLIAQSLRDAGIEFLTEQEWKESEWSHPALAFEPFMTPERAETKFLNLKKMAAYDYLIRQRPAGFLSGTAGFFAGLAGDPVNYIPGTLPFREFYAGARIGLPALFKTTTRTPGAPRDFIKLGEYAGESIPARSSARNFTNSERAQINRIGSDTGCHTCGTKDPGTVRGNFVPDHQSPSALNPAGQLQRLYPQCLDCSSKQGLAILHELRKKGSR